MGWCSAGRTQLLWVFIRDWEADLERGAEGEGRGGGERGSAGHAAGLQHPSHMVGGSRRETAMNGVLFIL